MNIGLSLRTMKGIGEKTEQLFLKLGVQTIGDLLSYYPREYERFDTPLEKGPIPVDELVVIAGKVRTRPIVKPAGTKKLVFTTVACEEMIVDVQWFNVPYLVNTVRTGGYYIFRGKTELRGNKVILVQPAIYTPAEYEQLQCALSPLYSLTKGLTNNLVRKTVRQVLEQHGEHDGREELLPERLLEEYQLMHRRQAVEQIHFPADVEQLKQAKARLVFEEFFWFLLQIELQKAGQQIAVNHYEMKDTTACQRFLESLPFSLTEDQEHVWKEMCYDFAGSRLMNRMVQGDVGSGKTVLAILGSIMAAFHGYQAAVMAPTEVLATQHYEEFQSRLQKAGLQYGVCLLTGSMTVAQKREVYQRIAAGEISIVIGTHALIQEKVRFHQLAFVVTDEQHRFGVKQRLTLEQKGQMPHVLVMSATPIPRTLALLLYGDLSLSTIKMLPAGRQPIKNCVIPKGKRKTAYQFILREIAAGHQAYVICPMVEASESIEAENVVDYTARLKELLPKHIRVAYLHGRMKAAEKTQLMERFSNRELDILVSTTVIEVGINVPNATVMMIENAERFGLAQLHQLRGRVGRGSHQSYCIFINGNEKQSKNERLEIISHSNDGFYVAEKDLQLRGPGDLLGVRQSGEMDFKLADIYSDVELLMMAKEAVGELMHIDGTLSMDEHRPMGTYVENLMKKLVL